MKHIRIVTDIPYLRETELEGWKLWAVFILVMVLILLTGLQPIPAEGQEYYKAEESETYGQASFYDYKLGADGYGRVCRRGNNCYTEKRAVAASREYPRGSIVRVTNLKNGKAIVVQITDWIEHPKRVIDLSSYAFGELAELKHGLFAAKVEPLFIPWNFTEISIRQNLPSTTAFLK